MGLFNNVLIAFFIFLLTPVFNFAYAENLLWGAVPIPGAFNVRDGEVVGGWMHEAFQLLAARMPELSVQYEVMPAPRLEQRLRNKEELCGIGQLQSPIRDKIAYFIPFAPTTPLHVVFRRKTSEHLLIENGYVSLDWLITNSDLHGGVSRNRIYPEPIRQRLQQGLASGQLTEIGGSLGGENILMMVSRNRLDYVFEFPMISDAIVQKEKIMEPLVSIPLRENDKLETIGIYCPKTPWGKNIAVRIDQGIRSLASDEKTLMGYYKKRWPADLYVHYASSLKDFYRKRSQANAMFLEE